MCSIFVQYTAFMLQYAGTMTFFLKSTPPSLILHAKLALLPNFHAWVKKIICGSISGIRVLDYKLDDCGEANKRVIVGSSECNAWDRQSAGWKSGNLHSFVAQFVQMWLNVAFLDTSMIYLMIGLLVDKCRSTVFSTLSWSAAFNQRQIFWEAGGKALTTIIIRFFMPPPQSAGSCSLD